jgi:hypothetical protein
MFLLSAPQPFREIAIIEELNLADDRCIDVDQCLHGRYEERARPTCRIEQAESGQDVIEEFTAELRVEVE